MIPSSNGVSPWGTCDLSEHHMDEFDPLKELLSEEMFTQNQNKTLGEPEDHLAELPQLSAASSWDCETQRLFPELFGIKQQAERDARASYYEYEVKRSEVTHRISVGGGEEFSVTHTVHRGTVRWGETMTECNSLFEKRELLSNPDTSAATCGFLVGQQALPHPAPGEAGHHLAERPVGGGLWDIDDGECGRLNTDCSLEMCCDTSGGVRDYERRPSSELSESDVQFFGSLLQELRDNSWGYEANCGSAIDQNIVDNFRNAELP